MERLRENAIKPIGSLGRISEEEYEEGLKRPYERAKGLKKKKKIRITGVREPFKEDG